MGNEAQLARKLSEHLLPAVPGADPLAVIQAGLDYLRVREEEQTKRAYIAARRDVLVEAIRAEQKLIQRFFDQRFAERRGALDQLYAYLDRGVRDRDDQLVDRALGGILGILQDNPLRDLETFRSFWARPDAELEL